MTNKETVAQALAGDQAAYATIVETYHDRLYNDMFRKLGHREEAEEVVAWAFSQVLPRLHEYQERRAQLYTLLYAVARNKARDIGRKRKTTQKLMSIEDMQESDELLPRGRDPAEEYERKARADVLNQRLNQLTPLQRQVLEMRYRDELTSPQIGRQLGRSPEAVRSILKRGINALQQLYGVSKSSLKV